MTLVYTPSEIIAMYNLLNGFNCPFRARFYFIFLNKIPVFRPLGSYPVSIGRHVAVQPKDPENLKKLGFGLEGLE